MYTIYGTENCKWCDRAIELLDKLGEEYQYVDVGEDPKAQAMFREKSLRSVPQIFLESSHIGGFEALRAALK